MKWSVSGGRGPSPVRTELVEVLVQPAPALRQAQRERLTPSPVRTELVEVLVRLARALRQAQRERSERGRS